MEFSIPVLFLLTFCIKLSEGYYSECGMLHNRFDSLQDSLSGLFTSLAETIKSNQKITEQKIDNLMDVNAKLLKRLNNLESLEKLQDEYSTIDPVSSTFKPEEQGIKSCQSAKSSGKPSGVYQLQDKNASVYCEMVSLDGGWTVFQQRIDQEFNFNRSWAEYRDGFGTVGKDGDFWLGLEIVYQFTKTGNCKLAVEMKDKAGEYRYAQYDTFWLTGEENKYKLGVKYHRGSAEDMMTRPVRDSFSTYDSDNDMSGGNCAQHYGSGWWFFNCFRSNLNFPGGGLWVQHAKDEFKLAYTRMMFRCTD